MCMKNYLNTDLPSSGKTIIITSEVKFMLLKLDSLCTRLSTHIGVYQRRFRNEIVGIIKKFKNTVSEVSKINPAKIVHQDIYSEVEKCVGYIQAVC